MGFSSFAEDKILRKILKGGEEDFDWAPLKVGLHTGDPGDDGANEAVGGDYVRQELLDTDWSDPIMVGAGSTSDNVNPVVFPAEAFSRTITHCSLWSDAGDYLWSGAFVVAQFANATVPLTFSVGTLKAKIS